MASLFRLIWSLTSYYRSLYCDWKIFAFCDLKAEPGYHEIRASVQMIMTTCLPSLRWIGVTAHLAEIAKSSLSDKSLSQIGHVSS